MPTERFFRSLKTEWIPKNGWSTPREAKHAVNNNICKYYNRHRSHLHNQGMDGIRSKRNEF
ncbi:IS3 family transposase [Zooshikella marina]|uniref:IS3 family transposase n=1 Tax=Zooshikella ganghwensis TaxID=202772 RepID=UPI001BB00BD7|nr:IS3 family transposase [Zooshikella ganghwensis]